MTVNLTTLVPAIRAETSPPGFDLFATSTDAEWLLRLQNAFWEARMNDLLSRWTESGGIVMPIDPATADIPREAQQVIVLFTALNVIRTLMINTNTLFKAVGGPVQFEIQNSANLLTETLKELNAKVDRILAKLSDLGIIESRFVDPISARDWALRTGEIGWWGGNQGSSYYPSGASSSGYSYAYGW